MELTESIFDPLGQPALTQPGIALLRGVKTRGTHLLLPAVNGRKWVEETFARWEPAGR
jgi:hypothetical protein